MCWSSYLFIAYLRGLLILLLYLSITPPVSAVKLLLKLNSSLFYRKSKFAHEFCNSWLYNINIFELFALALNLENWVDWFYFSVLLYVLQISPKIYLRSVLVKRGLNFPPHPCCKRFVVFFYFWPFENFFDFLHLLGFFPQTRDHFDPFRFSGWLQLHRLPCSFLLGWLLSWLLKWILPIVFVIKITTELFDRVQYLLVQCLQLFFWDIISFVFAVWASLAKPIAIMPFLFFLALLHIFLLFQ